MTCDMCGKDDRLVKVLIEGTELNVCKNCSKYGTKAPKSKEERIAEVQNIIAKKGRKQYFQKEKDFINPDFVNIIKKKRQSLSITIEQLAKKMMEKESVISSIERGRQPSVNLAKKFERQLNIKLVEQYSENFSDEKEELDENKSFNKNSIPTVGSMIKIKIRKKK